MAFYPDDGLHRCNAEGCRYASGYELVQGVRVGASGEVGAAESADDRQPQSRRRRRLWRFALGVLGYCLMAAAVLTAILVFWTLPSVEQRDTFDQGCAALGGWVHESTPPMCIVDGRITKIGGS